MAEIVRELRSAPLVDQDVQGRTVRGYAAVYDSPWSQELIEATGYIEKIARGAFRKALGRAGNVPLLKEHVRDSRLATTRNKSLRLKDDAKGLYFEADIPKTQAGDDTLEEIRSGLVWGMSYGMATDPQRDSTYTYNPNTRTITNIEKLLDVTLTFDPAYDAATVELRSKGFVALPMQEIFNGAEEQVGEAAGEVSSFRRDPDIDRRVMAVSQSILEEGWMR